MAGNQTKETGTAKSRDTGTPFFIGITGTRGSGKSQVGQILRSQDVPVIDADSLGHEILNGPNEAYHAVLKRFGTDLVDYEGGPVNRKKLGAIVFSDEKALCDLEALIHEPIFQLMQARMESFSDKPIVAVEIPLLHEKDRKALFNVIWCVVADEEVLLSRLMARDEVDEAEARELLSLQLSQDEKAQLSDMVIDNSGTFEELEASVLKELAVIRQKLADGAVPDADGAEPDADGTEPDADGAEPDADGAEPDADGAEPDADGAEPDADGTQPDADGKADPEDHYRDRLRQFAQMSTDAALDRMGNVASTGHKSAKATTRMTVGSCEGDCEDGHTDQTRELEVTVDMAVRNVGTGDGDENKCSCGCGKECRVNCACAKDCGCKCKKPAPVPTPTPSSDGGWNNRDRLTLVVLAGFGLLAFLALLAYLFSGHHDHVHGVNPPERIIIVQPPVCVTGCEKPVETKPEDPPIFRVEPPKDGSDVVKIDPVDTCGKAGVLRELREEPGYAFRAIHNAVRPRIGKYYERYGTDCNSRVLVGRDPSGRLVIHQLYDSHEWLEYQLVYTYFPDRSIQVDRFDGRSNTFVGRTVFTVDQYGHIVGASTYDGMTRLTSEAVIAVNGSGSPVSTTITRYDANTRVKLGSSSVVGASDATIYLDNNLHGYYLRGSWFAK